MAHRSGSEGGSDPSGGDGTLGSARPAWLRWGVPAVVLVFVVAVGVGYLTSRPEPTYDEGTRQRFVEVCMADGGEPVRPACECLYTAITEQVSYDRFAEVHEQLVATLDAGDKIVLPDDIAALIPDCQIPA